MIVTSMCWLQQARLHGAAALLRRLFVELALCCCLTPFASSSTRAAQVDDRGPYAPPECMLNHQEGHRFLRSVATVAVFTHEYAHGGLKLISVAPFTALQLPALRLKQLQQLIVRNTRATTENRERPPELPLPQL